MKLPVPIDKDFELWVLLNQANNAVVQARVKELRPYSITFNEAGVLFYIQVIGGNATPA